MVILLYKHKYDSGKLAVLYWKMHGTLAVQNEGDVTPGKRIDAAWPAGSVRV